MSRFIISERLKLLQFAAAYLQQARYDAAAGYDVDYCLSKRREYQRKLAELRRSR